MNHSKKISLRIIRKTLHTFRNRQKSMNHRKFFKKSHQDIFLGVGAPTIRKLAKQFWPMSLLDVRQLMKSTIYDERSLANAILCLKFKKGDESEKSKIFNFYIKNRRHIRDWSGVDDSAPYIVGPYLLHRDKRILYALARSKRIWDRRIAMVSTWWFIRHNSMEETFKMAKILLTDTEDLIQKATGWMLRETGKRDILALKNFLNLYYRKMSRTTLRYAIERFTEKERRFYLLKK